MIFFITKVLYVYWQKLHYVIKYSIIQYKGEEELMINFIESEDIRNYLEQEKYEFSDFEKAALIYNNDKLSLQEKETILIDIMKNTDDDELKKQIEIRISNNKKIIEKIEESDEGFFFILVINDELGEEEKGYFTSYEVAKKYGESFKSKYGIYKKSIVTQKEMLSEDIECKKIEKFNASSVSGIYFNEKGEITDFWSEEIDICRDLQWLKGNRFENTYISLPHPFRRGDIVRVIGTDELGIVSEFSTTEEWIEYDKWAKSLGNKVDWTEVSITVDLLLEDGSFVHNHINPTNLEYVKLSDDDKRKEILMAGRNLLIGKIGLEEFTETYEEYKEIKRINIRNTMNNINN